MVVKWRQAETLRTVVNIEPRLYGWSVVDRRTGICLDGGTADTAEQAFKLAKAA